MKQIRIEDAVGCILSHDVTKIVPGEFKGRLFKKGHVIKEEDIEKLLDIGKEHIYVWEPKENELHENEHVIVFDEYGDEIIAGYLIKEYDGIYVESSNNVCMRIDDLWYDFYVMKRTSIDIIYNL